MHVRAHTTILHAQKSVNAIIKFGEPCVVGLTVKNRGFKENRIFPKT